MFETSGLFSFLGKYLLPCIVLSGGWLAIQAARKRPFVLEQHLFIWLVVVTVSGQIFGGAGTLLFMAAVPPLVFTTACMMLYLAVQAAQEKPVVQRSVRQICVLISVPAVVFPGMFIIMFSRAMFSGEMESQEGLLWIGALVVLGWIFGRIISAIWIHFLSERIATGKTSYG